MLIESEDVSRKIVVWSLLALLTSAGFQVWAEDVGQIDCPLRDASFSTKLPLFDLINSRAARQIIAAQYPGLLEQMPDYLMRLETPSFAAIMTFDMLLEMKRLPADALDELNQELAKLQVTDLDRRARCARYDNDNPNLGIGDKAVQVLVFHKINGFDHGPSVTAATNAIMKIADDAGWGVVATDKGGAINAETLAQIDVVVWNNISGDALTLSQRMALKHYVEAGGGFVAIHASGGDSIYFWEWYAKRLIGAQFIGHPMEPQFQDAEVQIEATQNLILYL